MFQAKENSDAKPPRNTLWLEHWMKQKSGRRWSWRGWQGLDHMGLYTSGKSFGFFQMRDFSFLLYVCMHFYQYGLMDIYCILWVIIQYYFIYFFAKIWPLGALSGGSWDCLTYSHYCGFLKYLLTFWHYRTLQARAFIPRAKGSHWIYPIYLHLVALHGKPSVNNLIESFFSWCSTQAPSSSIQPAALHSSCGPHTFVHRTGLSLVSPLWKTESLLSFPHSSLYPFPLPCEGASSCQ